MVSLQIISKILATKDISILENNLITKEYFVGYEDEIEFILKHYETYGIVPDKATFLSHFSDDNGNPTIELVDVEESDRYLVDTIREEYLYHRSVPVVQKVAELLKTDANAASEYMVQAMKDLQPTYSVSGVDIIADAESRIEQFVEKKNNKDEYIFTTGFEELDGLIHGINRESEYFVIFARTNQGKSWILEKISTHIWQLGFNVGYVSPEMNASSVGYRFDTLFNNFSNKALMWGKDGVEEDEYRKYIDELKHKENKFLVATPVDFDRRITVSKLRNWVVRSKLNFLAVDGITYMSDERAKRNDNKTTTLTNISEDLRMLSLELKIPVLVVIQANRSGVKRGEDEGTPELESIRDSDGVAQNATKVLSIRQLKDSILEIGIKKNTFGNVGGKLKYQWDIDRGDFTFIPSFDDAEPQERTERKVKEVKKKYKDEEDVF